MLKFGFIYLEFLSPASKKSKIYKPERLSIFMNNFLNGIGPKHQSDYQIKCYQSSYNDIS